MRLKMMNQVIPVEKVLAEYVDAPKFLKACSECPNYGKIASCPPYDFDVIDYWRQFKNFHIAAVQGFVPDELRERAFSADELNAKTREIFKSMRDSLDGKLEAGGARNAGQPNALGGQMRSLRGLCVRARAAVPVSGADSLFR